MHAFARYAHRHAWRASPVARPRCGTARACSFSATAEETVDWPIIAGGVLGVGLLLSGLALKRKAWLHRVQSRVNDAPAGIIADVSVRQLVGLTMAFALTQACAPPHRSNAACNRRNLTLQPLHLDPPSPHPARHAAPLRGSCPWRRRSSSCWRRAGCRGGARFSAALSSTNSRLRWVLSRRSWMATRR